MRSRSAASTCVASCPKADRADLAMESDLRKAVAALTASRCGKSASQAASLEMGWPGLDEHQLYEPTARSDSVHGPASRSPTFSLNGPTVELAAG